MLAPFNRRSPVNVFRAGALIPSGGPRAAPVSPAPQPLPAPPWDAFRTHAELAEWVEHWTQDHALALPDDWEGRTLAEKREWLNDAIPDPSP